MSHEEIGRKPDSKSIRRAMARCDVVPHSRSDAVVGEKWLRCAVYGDLDVSDG